MPRASDIIDDRTPLSAARIDVAARIGWLLRVHRTTAGVSLRQMSVALHEHGVNLSAATLSRAESEGQRSPQLLDGYTQVLGLPDGLLRASIDGLCRSFSYAPPVLPDTPERCLTSFSRSYDAVAVPAPTGGAWLELANQHARPGGFGLPLSLMEPLVQRLAGEQARAVANARVIRYGALSRLLESPYADLVTTVLMATIENLDHQNFYDLASTLSEHPKPEFAQWAGALLSSPSLFHVRGGSYVLQGMLVTGGLGLAEWRGLVPHLERAWLLAEGDASRETVLTQVCGALPPEVQAELRNTGVEPHAPTPPVAWSRTRNNVHYRFATTIARAVCARSGHADEPLMERLLFEALFEPRGVRMSTSTWVLMTSPFAAPLVLSILETFDDAPDTASRTAALRVAMMCHAGEDVPGVTRLLDSGGAGDFDYGTTIIGRSGQSLPAAALARGLAGDETTVRQTLHCLGMAGDPRLAGLAADETLPSQTRRGAAWWIEQGSRILV